MTQRLGARSGRLVRPRRGHHLPAGPGEQRLHPDHGLEHGRGPPGRLPLADEGARRAGATLIHVDPRFTRTSAMCDMLRADPRRQRHRLPRRADQLRPQRTTRWFKEYVLALHQRGRPSSTRSSEDTEDLDGLFTGYDGDGRTASYDARHGHWGYAEHAGAAGEDRGAGATPMDRSTGRSTACTATD